MVILVDDNLQVYILKDVFNYTTYKTNISNNYIYTHYDNIYYHLISTCIQLS